MSTYISVVSSWNLNHIILSQQSSQNWLIDWLIDWQRARSSLCIRSSENPEIAKSSGWTARTVLHIEDWLRLGNEGKDFQKVMFFMQLRVPSLGNLIGLTLSKEASIWLGFWFMVILLHLISVSNLSDQFDLWAWHINSSQTDTPLACPASLYPISAFRGPPGYSLPLTIDTVLVGCPLFIILKNLRESYRSQWKYCYAFQIFIIWISENKINTYLYILH